jgi:hypothetical protein
MRKRTYPSSRSRNLSGNCFNARSRAMWCVTKSARWPDGSSNALNAMASTNSTVLWARRVASSPSMGSSLSSLNRTRTAEGGRRHPSAVLVCSSEAVWIAPEPVHVGNLGPKHGGGMAGRVHSWRRDDDCGLYNTDRRCQAVGGTGKKTAVGSSSHHFTNSISLGRHSFVKNVSSGL